LAKLKIYTDENVDVRVAEGLRRRGIKAFSAIEKAMTGATDKEHFEYTLKNKAVIFTHDHHFLDIAKKIVAERKLHYGVIYVEMNKFRVGECVKSLALYAEALTAEEMRNHMEFL